MTRQELGYTQNMRKTVLSGLKATSSRLMPTSSFTGCWSQPSGMGSLCILGCRIREHRTRITGSQRGWCSTSCCQEEAGSTLALPSR